MGQIQLEPTAAGEERRGNRRAAVRYQCPPATPTKLYFPQDQEFQRAWVIDLSLSGIGLNMARPLPVGTFLVILLKSSDRQKTFELPAHIVHTTMAPNGDWIAGCEFTTRLNEDDLSLLLD